MIPSSPIKVFCSYAHEDEDLLKELRKHLSVLERQNIINTWYDRKMTPGCTLDDEIKDQLDCANLILLLISSDFLSSDYCLEVETKRALEKQQKKEAVVIPIILRPCDWSNTEFAALLALPANGTPVMSDIWSNRDEALLDIVNGIRQTIQVIRGSSMAVSSVKRKTRSQIIFRDALQLDTIGQGYGKMDELEGRKCYQIVGSDSHIDFERVLPSDGMLDVEICVTSLPTEDSLLICDANYQNAFEDFHVILRKNGRIDFEFKPNLKIYSHEVEWHSESAGMVELNKWHHLNIKWGWDGAGACLDDKGTSSQNFTHPLHHISRRFGIGRLASLASRPAAIGVGFTNLVVYSLIPENTD